MRVVRSVTAGSVLACAAVSPFCTAKAAGALDLLPPFRVEAGGAPIDVEVGHAAPLMADFDVDGNVDLLVGQFGGGKLRIYRNLSSVGAPQLRPFSWFQAGGTDGTVPAGWCVGFGPQLVDLFQSGRRDILSGSFPGEIYLFRQKPNRTYASPVKLKDRQGKVIDVGRATAVALGDWHGKGALDLVVGNIDGKVFLLPNEGTQSQPAFGTPQRLEAAGQPVLASGGDAGPCLADWDGDGRLDLLLGSGAGSVVWYRNIGSTSQPQLAAPVTLVEAPPQSETDSSKPSAPTRSGLRTKVAVGDWNHDGRPDLLVGDVGWVREGTQSRTHGWVWVYLRKATSVAQQTAP